MKNFVQKGDFIHAVLADTVKGGDVVIIEDIVGVAVTDGDAENVKAVQTEGVFTLPKGSGAIEQGAKVYWDGTKVTKTATNNTLLGFAWEAAATAETTIPVKLG